MVTDHLEVTAGVDMDSWSDSVLMPVRPMGVGFEGLAADFIPFRPLGVGEDGLYYYAVTLPEGVKV